MLAVIGCGGSTDEDSSAENTAKPASDAAGSAAADGSAGGVPAGDEASEPEDTPFVLGDLREPFDPPALEEVLASHEWIDRPVESNDTNLREQQTAAPAPELSAEEALKLRNDSSEANAKIAAAVGRLVPESGEGVDDSARFVRHVGADLKSTNPLLMSSKTEFEYHDMTAIGLLSRDIDARAFAQAEYVESWQSSEDRMVDKFVLRDDLTWSDGTPVTAYDFEYTFQVIMTRAVIVPAIRQGTDELLDVVAYDDQTLVVFHKEAMATNDGNIQFPAIPKHVYEETIPEDPTLARSDAHSRLEDNPVVAGPYELVKRVRGDEFVLRLRKAYYDLGGETVRQKPHLEEVRVKWIQDFNTALLALKQGDIEEMMLRAEQWVAQATGDDFYRLNTKVSQTEWTEFHFVWNCQGVYFDDPRVRWAMTHAVDYEELLETICYGLYEPARGVYHPDSWMFPDEGPEPIEQDLDRAQELLAEAGWEDTDGDGVLDKEIDGRRVPFEFTMLTYQSENGIATATLMKECLDLLGIVCNVKPTEFTVLQQKQRDHEFDAAMGGWGAGKDPDTNQNIFGSTGGRNYGEYESERVDGLFELSKRELDFEKRADLYGQIHLQLWEDQPYTWLFYRAGFYAFSKKLRGYNLSPWGPYYYSPGVHSVFVPAP